MCSGYINSFRAMRLNVGEEEQKERRLKELQVQEDKVLGVWAKKQLRIEQQIVTKQSPLQRARRIRNKRQEEINRIHSSIAKTENKTCEKRLSKRLNSCHGVRRLVEETSLVSPKEDISKSSSSISLPAIPAEKQTYARRNSLPILYHSTPWPAISPSNVKRSPLPTISNGQLTATASRRASQPLSHHKLPPLQKGIVG